MNSITAEIGRLLCLLHEQRLALFLDGEHLKVEGHFSDALLEELRDVKPILIGLLRTPPDQLPDDWRRMLYRLEVVPDEVEEELHYHDRRA